MCSSSPIKNWVVIYVPSSEITFDDTTVNPTFSIPFAIALMSDAFNEYSRLLSYRLVFNLYVMDDYSHKEIAEMLGINIGTSKSNLARAKAILKDKIESNSNYSIKKTK